VVASLALLSQVLHVAVVKRPVESHGLARRDEPGTAQVTVTANRRTRLQTLCRGILVACHTLEVIDVHDRVTVLVREAKELL